MKLESLSEYDKELVVERIREVIEELLRYRHINLTPEMTKSLAELLIFIETSDFIKYLGSEERFIELWVTHAFPVTGKYWYKVFSELNQLFKERVDLANLLFYPKGAAYPGNDKLPAIIYLNEQKAGVKGDISVTTLVHEIKHYLDYQEEVMSEVVSSDKNNLYNAKVIGEVVNILSIIVLIFGLLTKNNNVASISLVVPVLYFFFTRLKYYEFSKSELSADSYDIEELVHIKELIERTFDDEG